MAWSESSFQHNTDALIKIHERQVNMTLQIFSYLVQRESFGQGKSPPRFECPSNHRGAGGWGGAGEPEGVGELQPSHLHAEVHQVDGRVEERQLRPCRDRSSVLGLQRTGRQ